MGRIRGGLRIACGMHIVLAKDPVHVLQRLDVDVTLVLVDVPALDIVVDLLPQDMQGHESAREGPEGGRHVEDASVQ